MLSLSEFPAQSVVPSLPEEYCALQLPQPVAVCLLDGMQVIKMRVLQVRQGIVAGADDDALSQHLGEHLQNLDRDIIEPLRTRMYRSTDGEQSSSDALTIQIDTALHMLEVEIASYIAQPSAVPSWMVQNSDVHRDGDMNPALIQAMNA